MDISGNILFTVGINIGFECKSLYVRWAFHFISTLLENDLKILQFSAPYPYLKAKNLITKEVMMIFS